MNKKELEELKGLLVSIGLAVDEVTEELDDALQEQLAIYEEYDSTIYDLEDESSDEYKSLAKEKDMVDKKFEKLKNQRDAFHEIGRYIWKAFKATKCLKDVEFE